MTNVGGGGVGSGPTIPVSIIVGGVIGGVAVLGLIALGISFILIQRRRLNGLQSPSQPPASQQYPQVSTRVQTPVAHELEHYFTALPPQHPEQQRVYGSRTPEYGSGASPSPLNQLHGQHHPFRILLLRHTSTPSPSRKDVLQMVKVPGSRSIS